MSNEQENKQKRRLAVLRSVQEEDHRDERIGLWVALGAAAAVVIGVLGFSVFGSSAGKAAMGASEEVVATCAEHIASNSVAADCEASAEELALANAAAQSEGMTAPSDEVSASGVGAILTNAAEDIADDVAKVIVEEGVVKFYFASGKAELADNAMASLQTVVEGVKEGKKAVVSGYSDSTGSAELNAELSKQRALQVRSALLNAGVPESSIEMLKPQDITGSGAENEARRVEVILK